MVGVESHATQPEGVRPMNTWTVIVSGSRTITDYRTVKEAIESSPWYGKIEHIFVGDARGVDALVLRWCKENGITYTRFKAEWNLYGKSAGPERNGEMIRSGGEALIAIWDGESKGTKNMMEQARRHEIPVYPVEVKQEAIPTGEIRHV